MNDTPSASAPLAPVESFATPQEAQAEYRRYAASPEYQTAAKSPHGQKPALARLEALARAAWPTPGQTASPAPGAPQTPPISPQQHMDRQHQQSAAEAGEAAPLTEQEMQEMAAAYAPQSARDYIGALPNDAHPFAAEYRQMFFDDQVSKSAANLIASAPSFVQQALTMSDAKFDAAMDRAIAETSALPGGKMMVAKALQMVKALPEGHFYEPFAIAMLTRSGGLQELAHWSDRLRAKRAA